ncbi:hypothetical protein [Actinomadura sp. WAC 06369]|uniref:hypothetical protein n=1 Tax=Actinomadura sp. WAC 06369 TaxID=2203193 RepID=UPI000F7A4771|nr:hypothetical protein [Actinomadura sp. WAC 06369]
MTPGVPDSGSWPPPEEIVTVKLKRSQWNWAVSVLEHWNEIAEGVKDHEEAAEGRAVRDLIRARLAS